MLVLGSLTEEQEFSDRFLDEWYSQLCKKCVKKLHLWLEDEQAG
jgi:hypothetical protein